MKHLVHRLRVYLSLYLCYLKLNLLKNIQYRANFIVGVMINLSGSLVLFYFYDVIFEKMGNLGTWDKSHAMMLIGSYIIVESLYVGLTFHSFSLIPRLIVTGELDRYLTRPISPRASLALQETDFGNILNGLMGVWLIYYYISPITISVFNVLNYIVTLGLGFFFLSNVLFFLMSFAFWLGRVDELRDMLAWVIELGSKPAFVYPALVRNVFYWILPFFLMANTPTEFLLGERHNVLIFVGAVIPVYLGSRFIWQLGLRKYVSASH